MVDRGWENLNVESVALEEKRNDELLDFLFGIIIFFVLRIFVELNIT